jgi:hypothetical protein
MNIIPFVTVLLVIVLSLLITRIATIILTYTGLSRESAKFQARSAFTGAGFTTTESEKVVTHPVRRRVVGMLMLLGNAGIVTVMSGIIVGFVGVKDASDGLKGFLILAVGLLALWGVTSSKWIDSRISMFVEWLLRRYTRLNVQDYAKLLHIHKDYAVTEMAVRKEDWVSGKTLAELALPKEGILVLGIERGGGVYLGLPRSTTRIQAGDTLILYGQTNDIHHLDERKQDVHGALDRRKQERTVVHALRKQEKLEKKTDPERDGNQPGSGQDDSAHRDTDPPDLTPPNPGVPDPAPADRSAADQKKKG